MSPVLVTLLCTVRDCRLPLAREERRYVCERGHSFDIARSGYVNLLQPNERRAKVPGDSPEAVAARRRFLDRGFAEPLRRELVRIVGDAPSLLDAGCGEGYYLGAFGRGEGLDISIAAIDAAAKRYRECRWVVGNADRFLPYADASFDAVLSITARMNAPAFRRVIGDDGTLIVAVSAPEDLAELRGVANRDRVERTIATFADAFTLVDVERIATTAEMDAESARDILTATYRPRDAAAGPVTLALDVLRFRPRGFF